MMQLPTPQTEKIMMTTTDSNISSRQFRASGNESIGRPGLEGSNGLYLRDTLAHTEVRELSFAEFRAAMDQMRRVSA